MWMVSYSRSSGFQSTPGYEAGRFLIRVRAQRGDELWEIVLEVQRKQRLLVPYTLWIR